MIAARTADAADAGRGSAIDTEPRSQKGADDLAALWAQLRADLQDSLPEPAFEMWLAPLRPLYAQGRTLYLSGPDRVRAWVERRYSGTIAALLARRSPELTEVALVPGGAPDAPPGAGAPARAEADPAHIFERFVIGECNRLAHAAALAVAEMPGEAYNPLFIHGPPGLGKTHLLGAIANYLQHTQPGLEVHLTTAERFTTEFVAALRSAGPQRFKERYRNLDALLIDDVQVLEGKERTQEEFVHTFNALHAAGAQIALSSDRPPDALEQLAERLRDRFSWGLTIEISPADLPTRTAVLSRLASRGALRIDDAALGEIARLAPANIRGLEGALTRALAIGSMLGEPLTRELARAALPGHEGADADPNDQPQQPGISEIQDAVCSTLHLSPHELASRSRSPRTSLGRQLAMYLAREHAGLTYTRIATAFDRDHSTVVHAVRTIHRRLPADDALAHQLALICAQLGIPRPSPSPPPVEPTTRQQSPPHR